MCDLHNLNTICDQFEDVFQAGDIPDISSFLSQAPPSQKEDLLTLLLPVDIEYRTKRQEKVQAEFYENHGDAALAMAKEIIALSSNNESHDTLTTTSHDDSRINSGSSEVSSSKRIGNYKLLQKIGEGGMGEVWMAQQTHPVRRRVALKLIKDRNADRKVIARFEAERQALAMMDHQNIAKVLDAGRNDGLPYFAMELVTGIPITDYCDQNKLSLPERLKLFVQVCKAVQHAHQKGLIHRDLKPANILVCVYDGEPLPKVIDFGLAKALQPELELTDKTMFTEFGQVLGTVQYMSPEQAVLDALDVDTRSDIYSLGVILYELLVGSTPLERRAIQQKKDTLLQILASIRDQDPPLPSDRLSSSGEKQVAISQNRKTLPPKLQQLVKGDLDWIVMKALEKERNRRFETANDFAEDIQRFLRGDAILARPASASYKARKFIRRNRRLVFAAASIFMLMACAAAVSSRFAIRAHHAKNQAELSSQESKRSAKRSADVLRVVTSAFKSADPTAGATYDMSAEDVLKNAYEFLNKSELDDLGKADLLDSLTTSFIGIGRLHSAVSTAEEAVELRAAVQGKNAEESTHSILLLARCYSQVGRTEQALTLLTDGLKIVIQRDGADHANAHLFMMDIAKNRLALGENDEALRLVKQIVESRTKTLGLKHQLTFTALGNLANCYDRADMNEKALELREKAAELTAQKYGPDHARTVSATSNLANSYHMTGRTVKALELREQVLRNRKRILGPQHPETLSSMHNLAISYRHAEKFADALKLRKEALAEWKKLLGPKHARTLTAKRNLALAFGNMGDHSNSAREFNEIYEMAQKTYGSDNVKTHAALNEALWSQFAIPVGDPRNKESQKKLELMRALTKQNPSGSRFNTLAVVEYRFENYDAAVKAALESATRMPKELNLSGPHPIDLAVLAMSYHRLGDPKNAAEYQKQFSASMKQKQFKEDTESKSFAIEVTALLNSDNKRASNISGPANEE